MRVQNLIPLITEFTNRLSWECRRHVGDMLAFERTCLFWPTSGMLLSTFLCRGKFVHRYLHTVPTYVFLYVKNDSLHFWQHHSPNNNQLPAPPLLSLHFGLQLSYLSPLPTPLSPLPSPHSHFPSRSLSILFGLLSCCLIVPVSPHVVLHHCVLYCHLVVYRLVAYRLVASLRRRLSLRPLCSAGCSVVVLQLVVPFPAASARASFCLRFVSSMRSVSSSCCILSRRYVALYYRV